MDPTTEFFEGLNHRPPDPLLGKIRGTVRFELESGADVDTWLLVLSAGSVSATQTDRTADCTVRTDREFFNRVAAGEANPLAALLRNRVTVEGKLALYGYLNHLVPGPPGAHEPQEWVRQRGQRR
ncbi:SCP2 sterol-binding domain-containing protein [Plantactinospora sp. KLBMP9567]|uniref:SCP2 sterol-binding domain-containing protein n=1 Tax=unclassified Plantactinospora TaxID=2631981 RepID=UPI002982A9B7|nr:SCP2 sterol-binding domain-containing protein [Plantactinospora sp. KLBMP9567]MDW5323556.1 SCP2 sterol-binding domain-containing protein [Plantactinospora sp. KLBMP9567]